MTVHLIVNDEGKVFGLYKDRKLIKQKQWLHPDRILEALGIQTALIVFKAEEMKTVGKLPPTIDEIPITDLLNEAATIATIETEAILNKEVKDNDR